MAQQLVDQVTRWLCPGERTAEEVTEIVTIEQFVQLLGPEASNWVSRHRPTTLDAAVRLAEGYKDSMPTPLPTPIHPTPTPSFIRPRMADPRPGALHPCTPFMSEPAPSRSPMGGLAPQHWRPRSTPSWGRTGAGSGTIRLCGRLFLWNVTGVMGSATLPGIAPQQWSVRLRIIWYWRQVSPGVLIGRDRVGNVSTHVLVDSGCGQTSILETLLEGLPWSRGLVVLSCIHGDNKDYPLSKSDVTIGSHTHCVIVALAKRLPYLVILGRDWPEKLLGIFFRCMLICSPLWFRLKKTKRERRVEKWEGASMKRGWGLV
ncbi:uncharacterized protein LOC117402547 [Acipenser ruthenus]|uniref:uncharacterized protein LOC117402547 n=1 Tax=Acipenser ruthenus TaxID=7906 RepID=UPI0027429D54|nr:uncharacterized protein LOC117402547 [Acipenser ruthenus]